MGQRNRCALELCSLWCKEIQKHPSQKWTMRGGDGMKMNDGSECLLCELWQDVDDKSDLELCCRECREEIAWAFARRRAGDE